MPASAALRWTSRRFSELVLKAIWALRSLLRCTFPAVMDVILSSDSTTNRKGTLFGRVAHCAPQDVDCEGLYSRHSWLRAGTVCERQMILDDEQRRILEYVSILNNGGCQPTGRQINQWRHHPDRKPARPGRLLHAAIPAIPDRRVLTKAWGNLLPAVRTAVIAQSFTNSISRSLKQQMLLNDRLLNQTRQTILAAVPREMFEYETIPGHAGRPAVYGPNQPREKFSTHMRRLGWQDRDSRGGYTVSNLGHALLRADRADFDESDHVLVLDAGDELAYSRVIGVVAENAKSGSSLVVDGYLRAQQLRDLLQHTNARRFLVGAGLNDASLAELAVTLQTAFQSSIDDTGQPPELRKTKVHDRWLIGDIDVYGLGTSFNGVGRQNMTTLIKMTGEPASLIRKHAEHLWKTAQLVAKAGEQGRSRPSPKRVAIRKRDDGSFTHDGCGIRHRIEETAERCPKG